MLIRWGNRASVRFRPVTPINSKAGIGNAAEKFKSLVLMREAGVPCPKADPDPRMLRPPFLGRSFTHSRGTDIRLCMQLADAGREPSDYYIEYVPTAREYRAHVAFGRVFKVSEKVLSEPTQTTPWIRNLDSGYTFRNERTRLGSLGCAAAADAVSALGLDFGAVDLIVSDDANTYVLEVNTAPRCSLTTGVGYAEAIAGRLQELGHNVVTNVSLLEAELGETDAEDE